MAEVLRSHVLGAWHTPSDEGRPLYDAVTGAEVARLSSAGIDFGAVLDYGRRVGGPALRELTFHQRAALLKALAGHLREHREELYAVSAQTGATRYDSRFDVDGGLGVVQAYARAGGASCPTTPSSSKATSSRCPRAARSSASTSRRRCTGWRCRSTRSTSRYGARWRSSRPPSSRAFRRSSNLPAPRRTSRPSWRG